MHIYISINAFEFVFNVHTFIISKCSSLHKMSFTSLWNHQQCLNYIVSSVFLFHENYKCFRQSVPATTFLSVSAVLSIDK